MALFDLAQQSLNIQLVKGSVNIITIPSVKASDGTGVDTDGANALELMIAPFGSNMGFFGEAMNKAAAVPTYAAGVLTLTIAAADLPAYPDGQYQASVRIQNTGGDDFQTMALGVCQVITFPNGN